MNKSEIIKKSEFFHDLDEKELDAIAKMSSIEEFEPGAIIYRQDHPSDKIYLIVDGLVGIILEVGPMSQRQVQAASDYQVFGWSVVIPPYTRTSSAKALEKTKVMSWEKKDLDALFSLDHNLSYKVNAAIARVVVTRLREAYQQLVGCTFQD